uniref:Uncharacterized protein n=1 Tax=Lepeophtheirus salmonis TaxID=72036 RepID=A0A0K2TGB7_LEPSM
MGKCTNNDVKWGVETEARNERISDTQGLNFLNINGRNLHYDEVFTERNSLIHSSLEAFEFDQFYSILESDLQIVNNSYMQMESYNSSFDYAGDFISPDSFDYPPREDLLKHTELYEDIQIMDVLSEDQYFSFTRLQSAFHEGDDLFDNMERVFQSPLQCESEISQAKDSIDNFDDIFCSVFESTDLKSAGVCGSETGSLVMDSRWKSIGKGRLHKQRKRELFVQIEHLVKLKFKVCRYEE